ncbi:class I SAM-dependent methyltransferase, partial [Candidatus Parcubacteria bacterium]
EFRFLQESVFQLLKEREEARRGQAVETYDVVYCAGLFDYLTDAVCRRLLAYMLRHLEPGGLLIATNVHPSNPLRNGMEHLLDWHLVHRSAGDMESLAAELREYADIRVLADPTGVNVFLQARKPEE